MRKLLVILVIILTLFVLINATCEQEQSNFAVIEITTDIELDATIIINDTYYYYEEPIRVIFIWKYDDTYFVSVQAYDYSGCYFEKTYYMNDEDHIELYIKSTMYEC